MKHRWQAGSIAPSELKVHLQLCGSSPSRDRRLSPHLDLEAKEHITPLGPPNHQSQNQPPRHSQSRSSAPTPLESIPCRKMPETDVAEQTMTIASQQMKTFYEANGFLSGVSVLDRMELADARRAFDSLEQEFGKEYAQYSLHNIHQTHPWVMGLATHPRTLKAITAVLGPNVILLDSRFICKYPSSDIPHEEDMAPYVAWHQDIKYWGFDGGPVASVWLALDDVDTENGVLQVIPGSHKLGVLEHSTAIIPGNMLTTNQEIPGHLVDAAKAVECPLKAGQMSIHDGLTVHASEPNMSERRRCGFVIRYIPTTAYPVQDPGRPRTFPATVLVAGTDEHKHFEDHAPSFFSKTL